MASAIRRIPRVQGHIEASAGIFSGMAEYGRKVAGGELDRGGVLGRGKSGSTGRGEAAIYRRWWARWDG
jgi:hypothetical protein